MQLLAQGFHGVWLVEKLDAGVENTVVDNSISRIARREQNLERGVQAASLVRQLPSVHPAGQPHVGEQKGRLRMVLEDFERFPAIRCLEHGITQTLQRVGGEHLHQQLILEKEKALTARGA